MARKEARSMQDYVNNESLYARAAAGAPFSAGIAGKAVGKVARKKKTSKRGRTTTGSVMSKASKTERAARMKAKYLERQKSGAAAKDAARRKASTKRAQATPVRIRGGHQSDAETLPFTRGSRPRSGGRYERGR